MTFDASCRHDAHAHSHSSSCVGHCNVNYNIIVCESHALTLDTSHTGVHVCARYVSNLHKHINSCISRALFKELQAGSRHQHAIGRENALTHINESHTCRPAHQHTLDIIAGGRYPFMHCAALLRWHHSLGASSEQHPHEAHNSQLVCFVSSCCNRTRHKALHQAFTHRHTHAQHCMPPACVTAYFWHTRTVCPTHRSTAPPYVQHTQAHSGLDQPADHHRQTFNSNCHEVNLCFLSKPRGLCCCHTPLTHKLAHSTPHWRRSSKGAEHSAACPAACIVTLPAQPFCILQAPIISCLLPVGL